MAVTGLGYIGLGVSDIGAWRAFAGATLGMDVRDDGEGGLRLRVDARDWRIAVEPAAGDDIAYAGWEVSGAAILEQLILKLETSGTPVQRDDGVLAKKRGVLGIASFTDPSGLRGELFWGATERTEQPWNSPASVRGFVTGNLGLGHIVVGAKDPQEMAHFYGDILGFKFSDLINMQIGPHTVPVSFWHCNPRHHSLAFAPTPPDSQKLIHFMLQVDNFDDVGFALDRCERHGVKFATTLGRHSNDHMLSFYAYTPSGFEVEFGYGAREIDDATWVPVRHEVTSSWGHKFIGHGPQRG